MAIERVLVVRDAALVNHDEDTDNLAVSVDGDDVLLTVDGEQAFVEIRIALDDWLQVIEFVRGEGAYAD